MNDRNKDNLIKYGFIVEVPIGEHPPVEECVKRLEDAVGHPVNDGKLSVRVLTNDLLGTTLYAIQYVDNTNQTEDLCDMKGVPCEMKLAKMHTRKQRALRRTITI